MISSKQRAFLRSYATNEDTILYVGKDKISENIIKEASDALAARELIKAKVLENSLEETKTIAERLAKATKSELISVIGNKFILYKHNHKKTKIELPKNKKK